MTMTPCAACSAKNAMDILFSRQHSFTEPWLVHAELQLDGHLSEDRLVGALEQVDRRHPMLRAGPCPRDRRHWQHHHEGRSVAVIETIAVADVDRRRDEILSAPVDVSKHVLRLHVLRSEVGDRVVGVGHHAAIDGVGIHRSLVDLGLAYGGVGLVPETSWETSRDMRVSDLAPEITDAVVDSLRGMIRRTPVRLARSRPAGPAGVGALQAPLPSGASSVEVLVAALARTVQGWNDEHGRPVAPLVIGVPLNLRSLGHWSDGPCNASIVWPVAADPTQSDEDLLRSVRAQLNDVRLGRRSRAVRGFLSALPDDGPLPIWAARVMACSVALSAVKGLGVDADFGDDAPSVLSGWGTPPVSTFNGCAFGARLDDGVPWISVRYLRSWFSEDAVRSLLARLALAYESLRCAAVGPGPGPRASVGRGV